MTIDQIRRLTDVQLHAIVAANEDVMTCLRARIELSKREDRRPKVNHG